MATPMKRAPATEPTEIMDKSHESKRIKLDASVSALKKIDDQGDHECEVLEDGYEGIDLWKNCKKSSEHPKFFLPHKLSLKDIPKPYNVKDFLTLAKCVAQLTVRLTVNFTSHERPPGYIFSMFKGTKKPHVGTGFVYGVCSGSRNSPCPCQECQKSGKPFNRYWSMHVWTAKHVVFDTSEALQTVAHVSYDDDDLDLNSCKKLYGRVGAGGNIKDDRTWMVCVTHDRELVQQLFEANKLFENMRKNLEGKYTFSSRTKFPPMVLLCSHPHGCGKRISLGKWQERKVLTVVEVDDSNRIEKCSYSYKVQTCHGSSGAPVIKFGYRCGSHSYMGRFGQYHPHSGWDEASQLGYSGVSLDLCLNFDN